jgi:hypothetical protein
MKSKKRKSRDAQEHQIVLSASFRKALWSWLNRRFRRELKLTLKAGKANQDAIAEKLQHLIRSRLADEGLQDADDIYQLVIGTTAETYWCEVRNELAEETGEDP